MSLFGTSPDEGHRAPTKSSLFDDEAVSSKQGSGLFADVAATEDNSPWAFTSPQKKARANAANLVKTLLPAGDVPESYIDTYDALLSDDATGSTLLNIASVRRLVQGTSLTSDQQENVLSIATSNGQTSSLGRGEFNVLLALIGLAQEGEDATLDGVDERRLSKRIAGVRICLAYLS